MSTSAIATARNRFLPAIETSPHPQMGFGIWDLDSWDLERTDYARGGGGSIAAGRAIGGASLRTTIVETGLTARETVAGMMPRPKASDTSAGSIVEHPQRS